MNDFLKYLSGRVTSGGMSRREFMGRAATVGLTLTAASQLYSGAALAQAPKRGGHLKLGLEGSSATDILDPAKALVQFHLVVSRNWGDTLVESHSLTGLPVPSLAESWQPSADASVWSFKIRKGVQFHNGKELTVEDVVKTLERHSDKKSESGALGVVKSITGIKADGGDLVISLSEGNADLPLLLSDYHLVVQPGGGYDNPNAAIGTGPYKLKNFEAGVREDFDKLLLKARSELDEAKRKALYRDMAVMVRDDGGLILPMFNDFVNASTKAVKGYVHDVGNDMSNGYVATRVWLDS